MKTTRLRLSSVIASLLVVTSLLGVTGCQSANIQQATPDALSAVVRPVAKNVVNLVLARNPHYDSALLALAAASDAALNGGPLTPANIKAFVDVLALQYELTPDAKLYIASAIDDLVKFYQDTYGQSVADTTDPTVRKILTAFAAGIRDGVTFFHALNDQPATLQSSS